MIAIPGKTLWPLLLIAFLIGLLLPPGAFAQGGVEIQYNSYENRFPEEIVFRLQAKADRTITAVTLFYQIEGSRSWAYAYPEDFSPTREVKVAYSLKNNTANTYIPPTSQISYFWELRDEAGGKTETPPVAFRYDDIRFPWKQFSQGDITLLYYSGGEAMARRLLASAQKSLERLSQQVGATYEKPVRIIVYASKQDMDPALPRKSEAYAREVITQGSRLTDEILVLLGLGDVEEVLAHELSHMVVHQVGEGPYSTLPAWLDEGLAMYAQGPLGVGYRRALERAAKEGGLISVQSLSGYVGKAEEITLFYAESYSVVDFLLREHGPEKMRELLSVFKQGSRPDEALKQVYGFDVSGLDTRWKASLGVAPPTPTPLPPEAVSAPTQGPSLAIFLGMGGILVFLGGGVVLVLLWLRRQGAL